MQFQFKGLKGSLLRGVKVNVLSSWGEHHFPINGFVSADEGIATITPIANTIAVRFIDWEHHLPSKGSFPLKATVIGDAPTFLPTHGGLHAWQHTNQQDLSIS